MPVRAVIADDQLVIRAGLCRLLEGVVELCGEAATVEALEQITAQQMPDIVVSEIRLGADSVTEHLLRLRLRKPGLPVLFYSSSDNPTDEARTFAAGANGFLYRSATREQLHDAVLKVSTGVSLWTGADHRRLGNYLREGRSSLGDFAPLTPRERQTLVLLTTGATNREISAALNISHETVKEHVQHVLKKIGVSDRTQAAVWAVRNGLA